MPSSTTFVPTPADIAASNSYLSNLNRRGRRLSWIQSGSPVGPTPRPPTPKRPPSQDQPQQKPAANQQTLPHSRKRLLQRNLPGVETQQPPSRTVPVANALLSPAPSDEPSPSTAPKSSESPNPNPSPPELPTMSGPSASSGGPLPVPAAAPLASFSPALATTDSRFAVQQESDTGGQDGPVSRHQSLARDSPPALSPVITLSGRDVHSPTIRARTPGSIQSHEGSAPPQHVVQPNGVLVSSGATAARVGQNQEPSQAPMQPAVQAPMQTPMQAPRQSPIAPLLQSPIQSPQPQQGTVHAQSAPAQAAQTLGKRRRTRGGSLAHLVASIDGHLATFRAAGNTPPLLDCQRLGLLRDACTNEDYFFLMLHRVFCSYSLQGEPREWVASVLSISPEALQRSVEVLERILKHNTALSPSTLQFCAGFPTPATIMMHPSAAGLETFLTRLGERYWGLAALGRAERRPLLVGEMIGVLSCFSRVLLWLFFTAQRRSLGVLDGQPSQELNKLFQRDLQNHRGVDGGWVQPQPFSDPRELMGRDPELARLYRFYVEQGQAANPSPTARGTAGTNAVLAHPGVPSGALPTTGPSTVAPSGARITPGARMSPTLMPSSVNHPGPDSRQSPALRASLDHGIEGIERRVSQGLAYPMGMARPQGPQFTTSSHSSVNGFGQTAAFPALPSTYHHAPPTQMAAQIPYNMQMQLMNGVFQTAHPSLAAPLHNQPSSLQSSQFLYLQSQPPIRPPARPNQQHSVPSDPVPSYPFTHTTTSNPSRGAVAQPCLPPSGTLQTSYAVARQAPHAAAAGLTPAAGPPGPAGSVGPLGLASLAAPAAAQHPSLPAPAPPVPSHDRLASFGGPVAPQFPSQLAPTPPVPSHDRLAASLTSQLDAPLLPARGTAIPIHEQVHDPHSDASLRMAWHQSHLRSPSRTKRLRIGEPKTNKSERHYQYVSKFIVPPTLIPPRWELYQYQIELDDDSRKRLSLTTPTQVTGRLSPPQCEYFDGSLRVRLRCCRFSVNATPTEPVWVVTEAAWPPNIMITHTDDNTGASTVLTPRRKALHGKDLPIELTDLMVPGKSTLKVSVPFPLGQVQNVWYALAVEILETRSHSVLISALRKQRISKAQTTLRTIQKRLGRTTGAGGSNDGGKDDDDGLVVMGEDLSIDLADPFTSKIFTVPVRGETCRHLECFDLETWLMTRESKPARKCPHSPSVPCTCPRPGSEPSLPDKWRCPICDSDARPSSLVIDEFLLDVRMALQANDKLGAKRLLVAADGTWRPVLDSEDDAGSDTDAGHEPQRAGQLAPTVGAPAAMPEIIEIDDD